MTIAISAAAALRAVDSARFDVILCDNGLPDMSGVDLMRLIRERCDTPAISHSAYHNFGETHPDAAQLFAAHLKKPAAPEMMETIIRQVLEKW